MKFRGRVLEKRFEKYIVENKEKLYKLAYCYVKNHHDSMDVLQESILKSYEKLDKIKDVEAMDKWICRIVINTSIDFIRKNSRVVLVQDDYLENVVVENNNTDIEMIVDKLDPELKSIIILKYFHGLKINEIADVLEMSISTV